MSASFVTTKRQDKMQSCFVVAVVVVVVCSCFVSLLICGSCSYLGMVGSLLHVFARGSCRIALNDKIIFVFPLNWWICEHVNLSQFRSPCRCLYCTL